MIDLTKETKERILRQGGTFDTMKKIEDRIATPETQALLRKYAVAMVGGEEALKELEQSGATVEVDLEWGGNAK